MAPPALRLVDLEVVRQGRTVLSVPDLEFAPGVVTCVVGPNGSGKSTLLQQVALLDPPARGAVLFDGSLPSDGKLARRRTGVVFQEPLLVRGSVERNAGLALSVRGIRGDERRRRIDHWLEVLGISHLRRQDARRLSGGEAQRVSLARALAPDPDVLLLDEPFSALDQPARQALIDDLRRLLRERARTVLFVTHDRDEALRLGDRIVVLIGGEVRQSGPKDEVFSRPADRDVAAFLGVDNVLPARALSQQDGLVRLDAHGATIEAVASEPVDGLCYACIRPEYIVVEPGSREGGPSSARNRLPGVIASVSPEGSQARLHIDCGVRITALVTVRSAEELVLVEGAPVTALFKASDVHVISA